MTLESEPRIEDSKNEGGRSPKPLGSGSSYYHRLRVRRAKSILNRHYRNLLVGGRLLYVKDGQRELTDLEE
jgi:hypothetical protein